MVTRPGFTNPRFAAGDGRSEALAQVGSPSSRTLSLWTWGAIEYVEGLLQSARIRWGEGGTYSFSTCVVNSGRNLIWAITHESSVALLPKFCGERNVSPTKLSSKNVQFPQFFPGARVLHSHPPSPGLVVSDPPTLARAAKGIAAGDIVSVSRSAEQCSVPLVVSSRN